MAEQQYIHSVEELRAIADLIDAMNKFESAMESAGLSVACGPEVYWHDRLMGHVVRCDEDSGEGPWCYRPARDEDGSGS
jgi:hypothetical protein